MTVEWQSVSNGYVLRGARYEARLVLDPIPFFRFVLDGISFGELPAVSCFDQAEEKEVLSNVELKQIDRQGDRLTMLFQAASNLWQYTPLPGRLRKDMRSILTRFKGPAPLAGVTFSPAVFRVNMTTVRAAAQRPMPD